MIQQHVEYTIFVTYFSKHSKDIFNSKSVKEIICLFVFSLLIVVKLASKIKKQKIKIFVLL